MATSESDDFESADEEMGHGAPAKRGAQSRQWSSPTTIDSDSDDDTEYVRSAPRDNTTFGEKSNRFRSSASAGAIAGEETAADGTADNAGSTVPEKEVLKEDARAENMPETDNRRVSEDADKRDATANLSKNDNADRAPQVKPAGGTDNSVKSGAKGRTRQQQPRGLGAKKVGTHVAKDDVPEPPRKETEEKPDIEEKGHVQETNSANKVSNEERTKVDYKNVEHRPLDDEDNMPEELKSNKKFKEIFKPQGWEGVGNDVVLPDDLTEEKIQPVLERLSTINIEPERSSGGWGSWGSWGVSSLINTATAGVSTLSNHVSQGLTLLEETIGTPDYFEPLMEEPDESKTEDSAPAIVEETQPQSSFGFSHLMSGVSSITKLVESTGGKVVINTLEAIGQKAMEVLQEGDPGLKKKRAFLLNEVDKPILSQVLREAKEKAEADQRTIEEKQLARKVHFESLFDDYQGLVHLEALEMLSKQSNIKIQHHLVRLESDELTSLQETLEEVKELCDLGEDDDESALEGDKNLKSKLADACHDLGVSISYDKVCTVCDETNTYLAPPVTHTDQEVFQCAISTIAQFTAYSVERFHKTAELLLIKERRSTVNEADSLVQLTRILSNEISTLANSFCKTLKEVGKTAEKSDDVSANITTVFMEAANASSYVQDAFRLLIPILQVGAI